MNITLSIVMIVVSILIPYLLGSISPGILIGKYIFKKDPRDYGSGNSGGTNVGRLFGKKIGLLVIILDALKTIISIWAIYLICKYVIKEGELFMDSSYYAYIAGLFVSIGHTFPIFNNFKGGKAVSCLFGIMLATNWGITIASFILYIIVLKWKKYVSLCAIVVSFINALISLIPIFSYTSVFGLTHNYIYSIFLFIMAIFVSYKHKENLKRIINGTERKITWMK